MEIQIHWNKLEWVNLRIRVKRKIHFCVFYKYIFKDNVKSAHWVGLLYLISLDTDDFFKRTPVFDYIQAIVTSNTIKQSDSGKKRIQIYYKKNKNKKLKRLMMMLI